MNSSRSTVVVLGAGIAGLLSAHRLANLGYGVTVVDPASRVMAGASSRNEGWIHAGTYHALSIRDRAEAMQVAQRCLAGWRTYTTEFDVCLQPEQTPSVAILREDFLDEALGRWDDAGVAHREAPPALRRALEGVSLRDYERLYVVSDRSINVSMLAMHLHKRIVSLGGTFVLGATPQFLLDGALTVKTATGESIVIEHDLLVLAAGYSTRAVCSQLGLPAPQIRLWQSHLAILPRLAASSVFSVHPHEAAMANHGDWSIVGLNEDAQVVPVPTFDPTPVGRERLLSAIASRFGAADFARAQVISCVKVDVKRELDPARSLNISLQWLDEGVISLLPGKMTEAPWAVDTMMHEIFERLESSVATARPLDVHRFQFELENAQGSAT